MNKNNLDFFWNCIYFISLFVLKLSEMKAQLLKKNYISCFGDTAFYPDFFRIEFIGTTCLFTFICFSEKSNVLQAPFLFSTIE
jgi:hypothetical protein